MKFIADENIIHLKIEKSSYVGNLVHYNSSTTT